MLNVSHLSSNYKNIRAVRNVSLEVPEGGLVALIGANGSGKSTTMKTIAGHHPPVTGKVTCKGVDVTGWPTHRLVRFGLAYVPERPLSVLAPLSVEENIDLAHFSERTDDALLSRCYELFPLLRDRRKQTAGSLSGGEQQMLAMAKGLANDPHTLLIDSPVVGLAPFMVDRVYEAVLAIHRQGVSILFIEQNAALALTLCDTAYVLNRGEVVMRGNGDDLKASQEVIDAYLG
jgi:branched-chain amino acid transport system ATP-binding protein